MGNQESTMQCGGCGGMQVQPEVRPLDAFPSMMAARTPAAHAVAVYEEFALDPDTISRLQLKDPGQNILLNESGTCTDMAGQTISFREGEIVFYVAGPNREPVVTLFKSLSRAAIEYARGIGMLDEANCRYSNNNEAPSPLLCMSDNMYIVAFRPDAMSYDDVRCLLAEAPFSK